MKHVVDFLFKHIKNWFALALWFLRKCWPRSLWCQCPNPCSLNSETFWFVNKTKSARLDSPQSWQILFLSSKEQRNASCNHQQPSAIILKYIDALFLSTWFYHVTLFRGKSPARAKSSKFYSSSMIYKRKITMWRNFLSVWFFMQHGRWAFIYVILFRAYSIFVHRNCGSVSKSIRLLFILFYYFATHNELQAE